MKKLILILFNIHFLLFNSSAQTWDWAKSAGGSEYDYGNRISTDANGNSYVTGYFISPTIQLGGNTLTNAVNTTITSDMYIAKYDVSGNVVWAKSTGGNLYERGIGIKTDANGNSFVTGFFESPSITFGSFTLTNNGGNSTGDLFVVKYDASGNVVWAKSAGGADEDDGQAISLDAAGNVYVIGTFNSPAITFGSTTLTNAGSTFVCDFFIVKYDANGNVVWAKKAGGVSDDIGWDISTDTNGNSFVTGSFRSPSIAFGSTTLTNNTTQYEDIFVVKYDASGNEVWAKRAGGDSYDTGLGISIDGNGNCLVTGYFNSATISFGSTTLTNVDNSGFSSDIFVAKYDASGNPVWAKSGGGNDYDQGIDITTDSNGNSYVIGSFDSPSIILGSTTFLNADNSNNSSDIFIAKFNSLGNILWAHSLGGIEYDDGSGICIDAIGNILIIGTYSSNSISFGNVTLINSGGNLSGDVFVAKLNHITGTIEKDNDFTLISISPNPAMNELTIQSSSLYNNEGVTLFIGNMLGENLLEEKLKWRGEANINITTLATGLYFLQIKSESRNITKKFVKE